MKLSKRQRGILENAEFSSFYAHLRRWTFRLGFVALILYHLTIGILDASQSNQIESIINFVLGIAFITPFIATFIDRALIYLDMMLAIHLSAFFGFRVLVQGLRQATETYTHMYIPLTFILLPLVKVRPLYTALICAQGVLPMVATSVFGSASHLGVLASVLNWLMLVCYATFAFLGCLVMERIERARFRTLLQIHRAQAAIARQKSVNAHLLENLFPPRIRAFVQNHEAANYPKATVIFADLEQFTELSASMKPHESITLLNKVFVLLDNLTAKHNLLKVKTTGEVYMAVANIPQESPTAAIDAIRFSLDGLDGIRILAASTGFPLRPRFGVNTGFVVAGTLHTSRLTFDLFGDAVNVAHRMMYHGAPGAVQVSHATLLALPLCVRAQVPALAAASPLALGAIAVSVRQEDTHVSESSRDLRLQVLSGRSAASPRESAAESAKTDADPLSATSSGTQEDESTQAHSRAYGNLCADWLVHPRGPIHLKHHGAMESYFISREPGCGEAAFEENDLFRAPPSRGPSTAASPCTEGDEEEVLTLALQSDAVPATTPSILTPSEAPLDSVMDAPLTPPHTPHTTFSSSALYTPSGVASTESVMSHPWRSTPSYSQSHKRCRASRQSSSVGTSEIERAFDEYSAGAPMDILASVQATVQQRFLEDGGGASAPVAVTPREKDLYEEGSRTPEELASAGAHLTQQLKLFCFFRDPALNAACDKYDTQKNNAQFRFFFLIHAFCAVFFGVYQSVLSPGALYAVIGLRGVVFVGFVILFALGFVKGRHAQTMFRIVGISMGSLWILEVFVEFTAVVLLAPPSEALHVRLLHDFTVAQSGFIYLCFISPVIHSDLPFAVTVGTATLAGTWVALVATGVVPSYARLLYLTLIVTLLEILAASYQRAKRLAFLQHREIASQHAALRQEDEACCRMLESTLPAPVLRRLKTNPGAISQRIPEATIFFADFVKFTEFCVAVPSVFVVQLLDEIYARFDAVCKSHGVTPIATIGDCYFAGSGIVDESEAHAAQCVRATLAILAEMRRCNSEKGITLAIRVGLHTGTVFSGVLGVTRFTFDVWGPAVNEAKRIEGAGKSNRVLISEIARDKAQSACPEIAMQDGPMVGHKPTFFLAQKRRRRSIVVTRLPTATTQ